ncbi:MAG: alginate export family protein [Prevotella sp.]|jgi:hypothetical protein|nr:alginate export family protein [Prevotella sp.]MCI1247130.1 alginate export family protein [Prevotella sp.]
MKNYKQQLSHLLPVIIILIINETELPAQNVKIDAEIRSRTSLRDGFQSPLADSLHAAVVSELRTRIGLAYSDKKISTKITLQDSRIYGETGVNSMNKNSVALYEAWGAYQFTPELSVTLGRQFLEYDDKRLLSKSNWSNTGNSHDLALFKYEKGNFKLHVGSAWNNASDVLYESAYNVSKTYKNMNFIWTGTKIGILDFSALWLNDAFQKDNTDLSKTDKLSFRNTLGGNLQLNNKNIPLFAYATFYYQFGHDTQDKSLNAAVMALKLKYKFSTIAEILAGIDHFTGSDYDLATSKDHTFNKLYGVNHSFNGSMEYWATLPKQGLNDLYGGLNLTLSQKLALSGTFHTFSLDKRLEQTSKKSLGSEIDLTADYQVSKQLALEGGWSCYFKSHTSSIVKSQQGVDTKFPVWAYVMLTFKPTFFSK